MSGLRERVAGPLGGSMTFRTLCTTGFAWLALVPLGAANPLLSQTAPNPEYKASPSATVQAPKTSAVSAPSAPTIAEMHAMNAAQLDEAGDRMRGAKDFLAALDCYREALRRNVSARYYNKIAITEILLRHSTLSQKAAKKAIREDKLMAEAWNNLGVALYFEGGRQANERRYSTHFTSEPSHSIRTMRLSTTISQRR